MNNLHLNIIHFAHTFIPIYGGTTTRLMNLFMDDGNRHTMVVPGLGSQYIPKTVEHLNSDDTYGNITVQRVPLAVRAGRRSAFFPAMSQLKEWYAESSKLIDNTFKEGKYNLVYGHNPMEFALAALRTSSSCRLPLIYEVHGLVKDTLCFSKNPVNNLIHRVNNLFVTNLERHIIRRASRVIVQTASMQRRLVQEYGVPGSKIGVVYNGVDTDLFTPERYSDQASRIRNELSAADKTVFSYFGFLDENNGIKFFLDSLEKLPAETKDRIRVMIVGRGPYSDLVRIFSSRHPFLQFIGPVKYEEMPVHYAMTDVFVIPRPSNAATESLVPMKLLEAMSMKKIVLVSDVGGMTEVIQNGSNGLTYKPSDQEEFIRLIAAIADKPSHFNHLGTNAGKSVQEKYTWQAAKMILRGIYEEVLSGTPSRK